MEDWIEKELSSVSLGDKRLDVRFSKLLHLLNAKPSESIPGALCSWSETQSAYRFFNNKKVNAQKLLAPHFEATLERIREEKVVLVVQDTTEIDLTRKEEVVAGAGPLNEATRIGFYNHVSIAFTVDKVPLGVIDAKMWSRDMQRMKENRSKTRKEINKVIKSKPIEAKETYRWLEGYERSCKISAQCPNTKVVSISDSEGDIFDCLAARTGGRDAHWLIRAHHNRCVEGSDNGERLLDILLTAPILGEVDIDVSKNNPKRGDKRKRKKTKRTKRTAHASVRTTSVRLSRPQKSLHPLADIKVNAVLVTENDPPQGQLPVQWILLTSLPVDSLQKALTVIHYYSCRWQIEIFFKTLKTGCRVEQLQLETIKRYKVCMALYLIIAWRVMFVTMLGRECPDIPCNALFHDDEWKSIYAITQEKSVPKEPPTLQQITRMIATLGGYLGRENDSPPGPKAMWIGLQRVPDFACAWAAFGPEAQSRKRCV